ncbi:MAG: membrane protein [Flavobacteriales bacterium]|jgi:membrane protein
MIRKWLNRLLKSKLVIRILNFTHRLKPWGFEGLSLYAVAKFFIEGIQKGAISTRASAISFQLFLAIFPVLIMLLSLIPMIPIDNFQDDLFGYIQQFFPGDTFSLVDEIVADLLTKSHNTVFSVGFILSVFYASNSVNAILQGFNGAYHLEARGNPIIIRLLSVLLLLVLSLLMVIAISLIIFSGVAFEKLIELELLHEDMVFMLSVAKWIITFLLIYGAISILYNIGDLKDRKWKTTSAGATLTTILFIITSTLFAWFVNNFASYNRLYGSLGTLLILLIWTNVNSTILLVGFELNTSIKKAKSNELHAQNE